MNALIIISIVLPWLLIGFGCWLGLQLIRQNGRILLHLEAFEQRLAQLAAAPAAPVPSAAPEPSMPQGLPLGSPAPAFELPDLAGGRKALSDFRGRKLLLVFFNPRCGFCVQMAPQLAALPAEGQDGHAIPLVVSTGEAAENRKLVEEYGLRCPVLLQEQMEVASQYQCHGTPMGYLLDEQGNIGSEMGVGAQGLLALLNGSAAAVGANGHHEPGALGGRRSLAESKIERNGLPAGTPAPGFTLPRLDGGELSLAEYRGRKLLLVFSDPNCGPCDALLPQLVERARQTPDVPVLMVSRGDEEANRAKAAEHGLSFPVVLQRQWEISREYGMFATPIAYLVNEEGVIAADVAIGVDPILGLHASAAAGAVATAERRCGCGKPLSECGKHPTKAAREKGRRR